MKWLFGTPCPESEMPERVENEYGIVFPDLYKRIAREYNKAAPDKSSFTTPDGNERCFGRLISISESDPFNLESAMRWLPEAIGHLLIPFAVDPFGNSICFDYSEGTCKAVVFLDHETENVQQVAVNFEQFLQDLKE